MVKSKVVFVINNSKKKTSKKSNPFDFHINKVKLKVLGQKLSSCQGLPEISRNKALLKRTKTLLQEYNMKDKNNQFIDKRIGERNSGLTEDDRIMARFTAERKRMFNKKTMFNLSHEVFLTHRGQTLSEIERFEDTKSEDEEEPEESGALRGKFVGSAHFGGGLLTKNKQDRKSLIDELINESKKRKAERHCIKGEILEATKQLDEDWKSLVLIIPSKTKDLIDIPSKEMVGFQKKDTYDVVMRQLKFESYGQASLRLPTDEEIAKDNKERLERLEKERLRLVREIELAKKDNHQSADDIIDDESTYVICDIMTDSENEAEESESSSGSDVEIKDESNEESEPSSQYSTGNNSIERASFVEVQAKAKKGKKRKKNPSEKVQLKDEIGDAKKHEDETVNLREGLSVDEDHPTLSDSGTESSEDQGCAMDNLIDLMPPLYKNGVINELKTGNISTEIKHGSKSQIKWTKEDDCKTETPFQSDLPYVLNMPDSYKLFKDLLKNYSVEQHIVIIERLIKSNHPSLKPGNKKKMLNLVEYIIQCLSEGKVTWEALPAVALHLSTLKEFNNEECLKILVDNIVKKLDDFKSTFPSVANVKFLALYILLSLKPQGMEVLLPVTKPALSLACNVLSQTSFLSSNQITTALLCCYLLLQDAKKSSTVYTNAIIFLHNFVKITTSKSISGKVLGLSQNLSENKSESQPKCEHLLSSTTENLKICLNDKQDEVGLQPDDSKILYCSLVLMSGFVKVYQKYSQSKILFNSIHCYLSQLNAASYPQSIKQEVVELQTLLKVLHTSKLPPLFKAIQKPKALCLYTPSFHTVTVGKSHRVLPPEQLQEQKLLHKYKQEMKGAMRELRRDRVFLANVTLSEQARRDVMRMKKVKEIFGTAAEQQGELQKFKYKK